MKAVCCDMETSEGDHLYVMTASGDTFPGLVKIGRSKNPCQRALELQESQPYHIQIKAIYWGAGQKEKAVHNALAAFRVPAPGQEWFEVPVQHACLAIARIVFGDPGAPRSRRASSDDETEVDAGE